MKSLQVEKNSTPKNKTEVTVFKIKKEEVKDESFEPHEKYHICKEYVCEKIEEKFTLHEEVKHEISYHLAQGSAEYHNDFLHSNHDQIKEEFMFKGEVKDELYEQSDRDSKYSIDIVEHKILCPNDSNDVFHRSEYGDNSEHRSACEKEDTLVLGGKNLNSPFIEDSKILEKHGFENSDVCQRRYTHGNHFKAYVNTVHRKKEHECSVCHRKFSRLGNLKQHINAEYKTFKSFKCSVYHNEYKKSQHKHHKNLAYKKMKHECGVCQRKFVYKNRLEIHINSVHMGLGRQCDVCKRLFTTKMYLTYHINSVHMGIRYKCDICEHNFTNKINLRNHIYTVHLGMKHECSMCQCKFASKNFLAAHIDAIHMGIKYKCDMCKHEFVTKTYLILHINSVHMGIKYECDICEQKFFSKTYHRTHMNSYHKVTNNKSIVRVASLGKQTYVTYVNSPFRF